MTSSEKSAAPYYRSIMDRIKFNIASGEWKSGERLPSYRDLASVYKVSPRVVIVALEELEKQDLLVYNEGNFFTITNRSKVISKLQDDMAREELKRFTDAISALKYPEKKVQAMLIEESSFFDMEE